MRQSNGRESNVRLGVGWVIEPVYAVVKLSSEPFAVLSSNPDRRRLVHKCCNNMFRCDNVQRGLALPIQQNAVSNGGDEGRCSPVIFDSISTFFKKTDEDRCITHVFIQRNISNETVLLIMILIRSLTGKGTDVQTGMTHGVARKSDRGVNRGICANHMLCVGRRHLNHSPTKRLPSTVEGRRFVVFSERRGDMKRQRAVANRPRHLPVQVFMRYSRSYGISYSSANARMSSHTD